MKNLKLSTKLIGGFLCTALIIFLVGIVSIFQQEKLNKSLKNLGTDSLPAVENILTIKSETTKIDSLMRTLLIPNLSKNDYEKVRTSLQQCRVIYGDAEERFKNLNFFTEITPEWKELETNIKQWAKYNNQAIEVSKELFQMDIVNPSRLVSELQQVEIDHNALLVQLSALVMSGTRFTGGTDSTDCSLGKWMAQLNTTNPEMIALTNKLTPVHAKLHQGAAKIKSLMDEVLVWEAKTVYKKEILPTSTELFALLHQITAIADDANEKFLTMNKLLLKDASPYRKSTADAINKIVFKANQLADEMTTAGSATAHSSRIIITAGMLLGVVLSIFLGLLLTRVITRPLFKGVDLAKSMAEGDLTQSMDVDQKDEIGVLADSLNEMTTNLRTMFHDIREGVVKVNQSSDTLATISEQMSSEAATTSERSNQVATATEQMSSNQDSVAAAMEEASININMVSTSAEEMNSTISEIAQHSEKAKEITNQAVRQARTASERVDELGKAAAKINKVTEAINEISDQTNLLALNATIEAARAGEAGKGFAVVANEIKELAKETAKATQDIKNQIQNIQQATVITVSEINDISEVISNVDM